MLSAMTAVLPNDLTGLCRWVRYSNRKVPLMITGKVASSTDPATWTDYDSAADSTAGNGLGFVLAGDGIACIDLDGCIVDGELTGWGRKILSKLPDTYIEVSPSGTGLHIWGFGTVGHGRNRRFIDGGIEVYDRGRYMTVTGNAYTATMRLADISSVITLLR